MGTIRPGANQYSAQMQEFKKKVDKRQLSKNQTKNNNNNNNNNNNKRTRKQPKQTNKKQPKKNKIYIFFDSKH